jgi:hypothetical protein
MMDGWPAAFFARMVPAGRLNRFLLSEEIPAF